MPGIGFHQRSKPRIQIIRGFDPQNPAKSKIRSAPVKTGEVILSGQVISLEVNSGVAEFIRGVSGNTKGRPYFAFGDGTDPDVLDAEKLAGFDVSEDLIIETPYFKSDGTYAEGTPLTYDGATGNVKDTTLESGEPIIGYVEGNGVQDKSASNNTASNGNVLRIRTTYLPNSADAT